MMRGRIVELFGGMLSLVAPYRCPGCGRPARALEFCPDCMNKVLGFPEPLCLRCGSRMPAGVSENREECSWCGALKPAFTSCRSAVEYAGPIRRAILRFKFYKRKAFARPLAEFMASAAQSPHSHAGEAQIIVPVPLFWIRKMFRGYNQSELLCAELSARLGIPVENALKRVKNIRPQSRLNLKQRRENVKNAFAANPRFPVKGKTVMLVDDIMTSGSTINECSRVLKKSGAAAIHVFTLSRKSL